MAISHYNNINPIPFPILPTQKLPQTKKVNLKNLSENAHQLREKIFNQLSKKKPKQEILTHIDQYIEELSRLKSKESEIKKKIPEFSWRSGFILREYDVTNSNTTARVQLFKNLANRKKKHVFVTGSQLDLELYMILWTRIFVVLFMKGTLPTSNQSNININDNENSIQMEIDSLIEIISILEFLENKILNDYSLELYRMIPEMHGETVKLMKFYCKASLEMIVLSQKINEDITKRNEVKGARDIAESCTLIANLFDQSQRNLQRLSYQMEKIYHTQLDDKVIGLLLQYRLYFRYLLLVYYSIYYHEINKIGYACTLSLTSHKQFQELKGLLLKFPSITHIITKTELTNHYNYSEQLAYQYHHENILIHMQKIVPFDEIQIKTNVAASKITIIPKFEISWILPEDQKQKMITTENS